MEGDNKKGLSSIPVRYGASAARIWISIAFFLLIGFSFYPYLFHNYHWGYMIIVLLGVDLILIYVMYSLWENPGKENAGRMSALLKRNMVVGLIALIMR